MEITFAPRGILRTVWMKAFFHEVRPETVNIRNVKNQPPPPDTSIAVFEVQNRIPAFCRVFFCDFTREPLQYLIRSHF